MAFNSALFAKFLAASGADISQTGTLGANVNQAVNQHIEEKNYHKLVEKMLRGSGDMPDGTSVTWTGGEKGGATLKLPKTILTKEGFYEQDVPADKSMLGQTNPFQQQQEAATPQNQLMGMGGMSPMQNPQQQMNSMQQQQMANPFKFDSPSDQVNISPQHMAMALQLKQSIEAHPQDMEYKDLLIQDMRKRLNPEEVPAAMLPFETEFGQLTLEQFNAFPVKEKEYQLYSQAEIRDGKTPVDRTTFNNLDEPERLKFLKGLQKHPDLLQLEKSLKPAGVNININDQKLELHDALSERKGADFFNDPKHTEIIKKEAITDDVQRKMRQEELKEGGQPAKIESQEIRKTYRDKIRAGKGKILKEKIVNGRYVFTVKFPTEDEPREIGYDLE